MQKQNLRKPPAERTFTSIEPTINNCCNAILHDHDYVKTLGNIDEKLNQRDSQIKLKNKKLRLEKKKSYYRQTRITSLKNLVSTLKKKNFISSNCEDVLNLHFTGIPLALIKRIKSGVKRVKYSKELKAFALTLQFYSSKAYSYVRQTFNLALPHPSIIRSWYTKIPAEPGFTDLSFRALSVAAKKSKNKLICALMIDEMAIRKHVQWDGKKYRGFVDLGSGLEEDDCSPLAKNAFVMMVVGVNSSWKVPIGYFLVDSLTGPEKANLVKLAISRLFSAGITIVSLTCDGPSCHFTMVQELGASCSSDDMRPYFRHPRNSTAKVYIILDVCHMLKLVRNTLAQMGNLTDGEDKKISWNYIVLLHELQKKEGLHLANKLKSYHINWFQQKMKVSLAAQTLSSSVADAIEFCNLNLKMNDFCGSEATVKFIRLFDKLFDILNSRNPFAKNFKAPLRESNRKTWEPFLNESLTYIQDLKIANGNHILTSRRKTGFLGFVVTINSMKGLFDGLINSGKLKYLLTYKFSQDHLELFFCALRACGGFNNNPTATQFTAAYKRLLLRSGIKATGGNCQSLDNTDILDMIGNINQIYENVNITNAALIRKYDLAERFPMETDHDYSDSPNIITLSEYKTAAVQYIAGYVAKKLQNCTVCQVCQNALEAKSFSSMDFVEFKSRGSLIRPSQSVEIICCEAEKSFERMLKITENSLPNGYGIPEAISIAVLSSIKDKQVFSNLKSHMKDCTVEENHVYLLIKNIVKLYCKIRLYHLGKEKTAVENSFKIRKKFSKLILFSHQ